MVLNAAQLRTRLSQIDVITNSFMELSRESDAKLESIMETAKVLQERMEPLNKSMENLQTSKKKLDYCRSELITAQSHHQAGKEVEAIIYNSPTGLLDKYIPAMERAKSALTYFKNTNPNHAEFSRLNAIYTSGRASLEKEFACILKQSFPPSNPINPDILLKLIEQDEQSTSDKKTTSASIIRLEDLEVVSDKTLQDLKKIAHWLMKDTASSSKPCLSLYCDFRRENLRTILNQLKEYCKEAYTNSTNTTNSPIVKTKGTQGLQSWLLKRRVSSDVLAFSSPRRYSRKGLVRESSTRSSFGAGNRMYSSGTKRAAAETRDDGDEFDGVVFFMLCLSALVRLMQNEKAWLERLELAPKDEDKRSSLDTIIKGATNDLFSEGWAIVRSMNGAHARHEYHMVLSLIAILKKYDDIRPELNKILQYTQETTKQNFQALVIKLQQQSRQSLEVYHEYINTEKMGTGAGAVPPDATVHELTTNTLMFLDNLNEFCDIVGVVLQEGNSPISPSVALDRVGKDSPKVSLADYFVRIIIALIRNIERKSENYADEPQKIIFQINNLHYILKTVSQGSLLNTISCFNVAFTNELNSLIEKKKLEYIKSCTRLADIPEHGSTTPIPRTVDSKEKAHIKDLWNGFNSGFQHLIKIHNNSAMPDRELKSSLIQGLQKVLVPRYKAFYQRYSQINFTGKREKYMKYTHEQLEEKIGQFFEAN